MTTTPEEVAVVATPAIPVDSENLGPIVPDVAKPDIYVEPTPEPVVDVPVPPPTEPTQEATV